MYEGSCKGLQTWKFWIQCISRSSQHSPLSHEIFSISSYRRYREEEVRKTLQLCPLFTSNKKGEIQMISDGLKEYKTRRSHLSTSDIPKPLELKCLVTLIKTKWWEPKSWQAQTSLSTFVSRRKESSASIIRLWDLKKQPECFDVDINVLSSRCQWRWLQHCGISLVLT